MCSKSPAFRVAPIAYGSIQNYQKGHVKVLPVTVPSLQCTRCWTETELEAKASEEDVESYSIG